MSPLFFTVRDFVYEFDELSNCPPVVFNLYDEDSGLLDSSDDYMGSAIVYLDQIDKKHVYQQLTTFKKAL